MLKKITALILIAAAFFSLRSAYCDEPTGESEGPLGGRIHLCAFDKTTGKPIANIEIRSEGDSKAMGTTDENGCAMVFVQKGELTLELGGGGYPFVAGPSLVVESGRTAEAIVELNRKGAQPTVDLEGGGAREKEENVPLVTVWGRLEGRIVHIETKEPVEEASIFVRGHDVEAKTDADGRFSLKLPVGPHDISAVHPMFSTMTRSNVEIREGESIELTMEATPVGVELEAFEITAPRIEGSTVDLLAERQQSGAVSDVIGAEQISKAGDSDAAGALKRVTGVTIVDGKYVYVRGLGSRYSATLLNGLNLPSPNPDRREVPLDMFPTAVIESVVIQKTYSPDMPAEFGGGMVQIRTKGYPDDLQLTLELSGAFETGTTFGKGRITADRGPTDWLGIDGGHRGISEKLAAATANSSLTEGSMFSEGYSKEELAAITRSMPTKWATEKQVLPPDAKVTLTVGDSFRIGELRLGFLLTGLYDNSWDLVHRRKKDLFLESEETKKLVALNDYRFDVTTQEITTAGILAAGADFGEDHKIRSNTLLDRITADEVTKYAGFNYDSDADIRVLELAWDERMLFSQQVYGEHVFPFLRDFEVDWRYAYSFADGQMPDRRFVRQDFSESEQAWLLSTRPDGSGRIFGSVRDVVHDGGLDLKFPFEQWTGKTAFVKLGGAVTVKEREVDVRRFNYKFGSAITSSLDMLARDPIDLFVPENMTPDGLIMAETTRSTDNSTGKQDVFAGYLMTELPLGLGFTVVGGARVEKSEQKVESFELFSENEPVSRTVSSLDVLPAGVLSYEIMGGMLVRAGYSRTLNRPDFREMSPSCATTYLGGGDICGAPVPEEGDDDFGRALIENYDLRWEWYPGPGESISFGGFFKQFEDPIETVMRKSTDPGVTFQNLKNGARNYGLELDIRKTFAFIDERLEDLYFAGNATWVRSVVKLPDDAVETSKERALQGQSPYIFNAQLGYEDVDIGMSATLLYNVYGPRIAAVGSLGIPDVYEEAFHQLDFVYKHTFGDHFKLGFKAKNLLDLPAKLTQGGEVQETYRKGRELSLSLAFSY